MHGGVLGVPAAVCSTRSSTRSFKNHSWCRDPMQHITLGSEEEVRNGDHNCRYEVVQSMCQNKEAKGTAVTRTDHKLEAGSGKLPRLLHVKLGRGSTQIFPILLFAGTTFTHASSKLSLE